MEKASEKLLQASANLDGSSDDVQKTITLHIENQA